MSNRTEKNLGIGKTLFRNFCLARGETTHGEQKSQADSHVRTKVHSFYGINRVSRNSVSCLLMSSRIQVGLLTSSLVTILITM